ncbi:BACON domain-containing protein [Dictyobacter formicarum]|uniref:BACON domain-containing protein n=1 Tax=Dictyobacter formicarum TaxID=2778368 RepID=A0ABQ3VHY8_9CHLR|nr:hypothetical protein [Dictyobacter formicarum]GHO85438.1 hypothetical protein KSZ_34440 [Dictyobacter formicarum]
MRPSTAPVLRAAHVRTPAERVSSSAGNAALTKKRSQAARSKVLVAPSTDGFDTEPTRRLTWQKVVETPSRPVAVYPPRPPLPLQSLPVLRHLPYSWFALPRVLFGPKSIFWVCLVLVLLLVGGGTLSMVEAFKHNSSAASQSSGPALQVNPSSADVGAILSLSGSGLSPHALIGLFRDNAIPISDTNNASAIYADATGTINDTVIIGSDWGGGPHTIILEDAHTHRYISTPIQVTGSIGPLRPAHLRLSDNELDFSAGDQATNTLKKMSLSNSGAGQITWQATTTQPWLMLSPQGGTLSANMPPTDVMVAVNRADLQPGDYTAQVLFSSSAGDSKLPVKMKVLPLQAEHGPVLQLSPALLSFTGTDGGSNPDPQVITVSNPGALPLDWKATADVPWLNVSASSTRVEPSGSSTATIKVNTSSLLPGTYSAHVTFTGTGTTSVLHSPQSVYVSVTITPNCSLMVSPGMLNLTSIYQKTDHVSQAITLNQTQSCAGSVSWSAKSNTAWLSINQAHGVTPAAPTVVASTVNLDPGNHTGSITFTSSYGTQVLLVSVAVSRSNAPSLSVGLSTISFGANASGTSPPAQVLSLKNSGGAALSWSASATTLVGGNWLHLNQTSGQLNAYQSMSIKVQATVLDTMTPNTYSGIIRIFVRDAAGNLLSQNPQVIPVNFVVGAACTLQVSTLPLTFYGSANQVNTSGAGSANSVHVVSMTASSSCKSNLNWQASPSTTDGVKWLQVTPGSGSIAPTKLAKTQVSVKLAGLNAGPYSGQVTLIATDRSQKIVSKQHINVYLTVQPPCTLLAPTPASLNFSALGSAVPGPQTFKVGVVGTCDGGTVNVSAGGVTANSQDWLVISPQHVALHSGETATFTVKPNTANLPPGKQYLGAVALAALDNGIAIVASPQSIPVSLSLGGTPKLTAGPGSLNMSSSAGKSSQLIAISNIGDAPLDWTASLPSGTPAYFSLSANAGKQLAAGASTNVALLIDTTNAPAGPYWPNVIINATNSLTGGNVGTVTILVTITVVAPPAMSIDKADLFFSTTAGSDPTNQSVTISNSGGGTLNWTASVPDQLWLSLGSTSGLANASTTSTLVFKVSASGLAAQAYTASTTVTPSSGTPVTITVHLTVIAAAPTPVVTQAPVPSPQVMLTPTAQVNLTPAPDPKPSIGPMPTVAAQIPVAATPGVASTQGPVVNSTTGQGVQAANTTPHKR